MEASSPAPHDKFRPIWLILFALAGVIAVVGFSKGGSAKELVPWQTDLSAAMGQARADGKSVLIYFTADWCGPCKRMKRTTWSDDTVARALENYVPVKIDVDRDSLTAAQFGVQQIPAVAVFGSDQQFIKATVGGMDPQSFLAWLRS